MTPVHTHTPVNYDSATHKTLPVDRFPVNDLYSSIQGEGCQTGIPMVILRLHGCAVGCPWCDTKETWEFLIENHMETLDEALGVNGRYVWLSAEPIARHIKEHFPTLRWVLLTGGEPANYDLYPLVQELHARGYKVAIETSGTAYGHTHSDADWITVSPKIKMPGGKAVLKEAVECADEIKHVVGKQRDVEQLDALLAQVPLKPTCQICLQPVSLSEKATQLCIQTATQRGWRISIQSHKLVGVK